MHRVVKMVQQTSFSQFDVDKGAQNKLSPAPDFDGPAEARRVTDPFCLLLLVVFWGLTSWIGVWVMQSGNYDVLMHPSNYKGQLCGIDVDSNGDVLPSQWHAVDILSNGICIDGCPTESDFNPTNSSSLICKEDTDLMKIDNCLENGSISNNTDTLITCGGCMYKMGTDEVLYHCLPDSLTDVTNRVNEVAEGKGLEPISSWDTIKIAPYIKRFLHDLNVSGYIVIGVGLVGPAFVGLLLLVLLSYCQQLISGIFWFSAVMVPLGLGGCGVLMWFLAYDYELDQTGVNSEAKIMQVRVLGYVLWAGAALSLVLLVCWRRVIAIDILITKAAARSVREVKLSILFPFFQLLGYTIFIGTIGTWFLFLSTVGTYEEESSTVFESDITYAAWQYPKTAHYAFWFLFIVLLWTSEFILAIGQLTLSLCFSEWYFTAEKDEGNSVSVCRCMFTTLIRHAGTAAFGSLVIKFVRVIRAPALWIQTRIKLGNRDNKCVDAIICSCQCCFFLLERYMKFTDRAAYVQTALFGYSFTKGSQESYFLILRNARRMSNGLEAGWLSFMFVKVFIAIVISVSSFLLLQEFFPKELYSVVSISIIIGIVAWFVGQMFIEVMNMAVSTIIQCFLADEEMFGNEGSLYVPDELDEFLARLDGQVEYDSEVGDEDFIDIKSTQSQQQSSSMG